MTRKAMQKAFESIYLRQECERTRCEKEALLDELKVLIYDALTECDCVKNNLFVSEPNLDSIYESILLAISSIKSAAKNLETLTKMQNE